jgi:GNAT superfamily N-acetyltransferase
VDELTIFYMDYKISPATINDLKIIQELNLALFKKEYVEFDSTLDCEWTFSNEGENYFKKLITGDDGCVFVAHIDNKIIGYLAGELSEKRLCRVAPNFADLGNMLVLEEFRGMGVGTKLYQAFVSWCKSKGVGRLRVIASAQNLDGIKFYRKNGFFDYDLILEAKIK